MTTAKQPGNLTLRYHTIKKKIMVLSSSLLSSDTTFYIPAFYSCSCIYRMLHIHLCTSLLALVYIECCTFICALAVSLVPSRAKYKLFVANRVL